MPQFFHSRFGLLLAGFLPLAGVFGPAASAEPPTERVLFDFATPEAASRWTTVNDGVMGGRSEGRFSIAEDHHLIFSGKLSLENNGGFASVRSRTPNLDLRSGQTFRLRLRGDGRQYALNLYVPTGRTAFSYRASFDTEKDRWVEIEIPMQQFQATSFGRPVANRPLRPEQVTGIGILLSDKQPGPFRLAIDWIKVVSDGT